MIIQDLVTNQDFTNMMTQTRAATSAEKPVDLFPAGAPYTFFEQYLYIKQELEENLSLAFMTVFLVSLCFLMNPLLSIELIFVKVMTLVEIYGFIVFAGMKLNAVPVVNLIMATGVTVEFTVHLGYAFLLASGTREERVQASLTKMFAATMQGGIAIFLGILMIAFSPNQYFVIYFFRMYVIMILLGLGNGLVLLPVVLSLIGPRSIREAQDGDMELRDLKGNNDLRKDTNASGSNRSNDPLSSPSG